MKVYILMTFTYNVDEGIDSYIEGVFSNKEKAIKGLKEAIKENVKNYDYVEDKNIHKDNFARLFWRFDNNWDNYMNLEIVESEVQ